MGTRAGTVRVHKPTGLPTDVVGSNPESRVSCPIEQVIESDVFHCVLHNSKVDQRLSEGKTGRNLFGLVEGVQAIDFGISVLRDVVVDYNGNV